MALLIYFLEYDMDEDLIPIGQYAAQQRKSIYSIMQLANRGQLQAVIKEEGGSKQTYIVSSQEAWSESAPQEEEIVDYKEAYETLQQELKAMKAKLDQDKS